MNSEKRPSFITSPTDERSYSAAGLSLCHLPQKYNQNKRVDIYLYFIFNSFMFNTWLRLREPENSPRGRRRRLVLCLVGKKMENRDIDGEFTIVGNWKTSYWSAEKWACEHEINFFFMIWSTNSDPTVYFKTKMKLN